VIAQRDFGGFDARFHGATVRLSSEQDWNLYQALRNGGRPWPDPRLADEDLFGILSIASALAHEVRHFHDFLITPYGAHVFRLRVHAALNALQLLVPIMRGGANCLPVPIQRWCSLSELERENEKRGWGRRKDGAQWLPAFLPYVKQFGTPTSKPTFSMNIEQLIGSAIWNIRQIDEAAHSSAIFFSGDDIEAWQVYELSALLVQLRELERHGQGLGERYENYLMESEHNAYGNILRLIRSMWASSGEPFDYAKTAICVYWSLLGDYQHDGVKASPAYRLARLSKQIAKEGWRWSSATGAFGSWSRAFKLSTAAQGLNTTTRLLGRLVTHLDQAAAQPEALWKDEFAKWAAVAKKVKAASDHMISHIRTAPMTYVDPDTYIEKAYFWVNPNIRTIVEGFVQFDKQLLQDDSFVLEWVLSEVDGGPFTSFAERGTLSSHVFVPLQDAVRMSSQIGAIDALFRRGGGYIPEVQAARRFFSEETSLSVIKILG
jgi:hypothetical protein